MCWVIEGNSNFPYYFVTQNYTCTLKYICILTAAQVPQISLLLYLCPFYNVFNKWHYIYRFSICLQIDRYTNPHLSLCIIGMIYIPPHILIRGIYMMCDCSFLFHSKGWVVVEKWARLSEHTEYINTIHHTVLVVLTHIMCCKHSKNRSVWVCVCWVCKVVIWRK